MTQLSDVQVKKELAAWLDRRFYLRFHVSIILGFSFLAGWGGNLLMLHNDVGNPVIRYPLTATIAYVAFLLAVRAWLWYVGLGKYYKSQFDSSDPDIDSSPVNISDADGSSLGEISDVTAGSGHFGGGGASSSWDGAVPDSSGVNFDAPSFDVGTPDLDVGEGLPFVVVLAIAFAIFIAVGFGVVYYVSYGGPMLLAEAALEAAIAAGFFRSMRKIDDPGWVGGALKASIVYFLVVLLLSLGSALTLRHFFPQAQSVGDVIQILKTNG